MQEDDLDEFVAARELCSRKLIKFVDFVYPEYDAKGFHEEWFHTLIASKLDKVRSGEIKRLIITVPPQRGKSNMVSRFFPAQLLGCNPSLKIAIASYSDSLSSGFNVDCQRIMETNTYKGIFPETKLSPIVGKSGIKYKRNSSEFEVMGKGGGLRTVGIGTALTGMPVDIGIIDDPVKDSLEAESYAYRERVWNWYINVFNTRLHNDSRVVLCMTRWHSDDLVGRILRKAEEIGDKSWVILHLPAIKENDLNPEDPRKIGEGLWESRFSLETVRAIQKESPRTYAALYQQNPRPVNVGGEAYYGFKEALHVSDVKYKPELPLHITWDFNRFPYTTCLVWQFEKVGLFTEARQIDEICLPDPARTKGTSERFLNKYFHGLGHAAGLYIYGDPSGRNEGTTTEEGENNYTLIEQYLYEMHPQMRVASTQPSVDMRINWLNDVFENNYGGIKILINPACAYSINDYQFIKLHPQGGKLKEKGMISGVDRPCEIYGHTSDAADYILCEVFRDEYLRFQRGGVPDKIRGGTSISKNRRIF